MPISLAVIREAVLMIFIAYVQSFALARNSYHKSITGQALHVERERAKKKIDTAWSLLGYVNALRKMLYLRWSEIASLPGRISRKM
jgi:hypothetical protein